MSDTPLLLHDHERVTNAGRALLAELAERNPDSDRLLPALIQCEWLASHDGGDDAYLRRPCVLPGYLQRDERSGEVQLWNGWAAPLFERLETELIVAAQAKMISAGDPDDHDNDELRFDGDAVVISPSRTSCDPEDAEDADWRIEPDEHHLYDLGKLGWTFHWASADEDPFRRWLRALNELLRARPKNARDYARDLTDVGPSPILLNAFENGLTPEQAYRRMEPYVQIRWGLGHEAASRSTCLCAGDPEADPTLETHPGCPEHGETAFQPGTLSRPSGLAAS
jgi:hypothetical protein